MDIFAQKFIGLMTELVNETKKTNNLLTEMSITLDQVDANIEFMYELQERNNYSQDGIFNDQKDIKYLLGNQIENSEKMLSLMSSILSQAPKDVKTVEQDVCKKSLHKEEKKTLSFEEVEDLAVEMIQELVSKEQLPYNFFGQTGHGYSPDKDNKIKVLIDHEERVVTTALKNIFGEMTVSIAKCHPEDRFSPSIGCAIALHRLFELEVPDVLVNL